MGFGFILRGLWVICRNEVHVSRFMGWFRELYFRVYGLGCLDLSTLSLWIVGVGYSLQRLWVRFDKFENLCLQGGFEYSNSNVQGGLM